MRKYADVESVKVLSDQEQARINGELRKTGKASVLDLSDEEHARIISSE